MDYVGDEDLEALLAVAGDDDDDDDDVGADYVGARRRKVSKARKMIALKKLSSSGRLPAIFLGFDLTVAASTTGTATSEPNVRLRPTDLIIRDSNAADWQITNITIGRVNLIAGATGIPAEAFVSSVQRPPISAPELEAGTNAQIALTNLTAASSRFLAMMTCLDLSRRPVSP